MSRATRLAPVALGLALVLAGPLAALGGREQAIQELPGTHEQEVVGLAPLEEQQVQAVAAVGEQEVGEGTMDSGEGAGSKAGKVAVGVLSVIISIGAMAAALMFV